MSREWDDLLRRFKARYGDKFDPVQLHEKFRRYYHTDQRIKVRAYYPESGESYTRTGMVSTTMGWRPGFLLMHRSSDIGSSDVLSEKDEVVAVQRGRKYVTIKFCGGETGTKDDRCGREWGHDGPCDWKD
jgi:hypothetical protein